jgi:hypothetical protein
MATPLIGSKQIIFQEDVDFNSTNSEAIMTKLSKAALFSQDVTEVNLNFEYAGFFKNATIANGATRFVVTKRSEIKRYVLSLGSTGASGINALNIKVYDSAGNFVNDLFSASAEPSILSPSNVNNSYVGYNVDAASNIESSNLGAATVNYGTLNLTTLEEGYQLVGEVVSNASAALNAVLILTTQRLE